MKIQKKLRGIILASSAASLWSISGVSDKTFLFNHP